MKNNEELEVVSLTNSVEISPCKVNLKNFQEVRELFLLDDVWCSPDFLDILEKITVINPIVSVKKGKVFFHEIHKYSPIPFLTLTPHGILDKQFLKLYSRRGKRKLRKILGTLLAFFEQKKDSVEFFPRDGRTIVIDYIRRSEKETPWAICLYFESDNNTWNISGKSHPLELGKGAVKFSLDEKVTKTFRKKYFWERV